MVKEPLAFLRVLEWVSAGWVAEGSGAFDGRWDVPKVSPAEQVGAGLRMGTRG